MKFEGINATRHRGIKQHLLGACGALALMLSAGAIAQMDDTPPELVGVGVDQRLGESIPLDAEFRDEAGVRVTFGELLKDGKPIIVTPVFFNCPMLCTNVLNGLVDGLAQLEWSIGKEFNVVTYSFNPEEGPELAKPKREAYVEAYGRDGAKSGWRFLTGSQASITAMNEALGFKTRRTEDGLYAHTASIMFITTDGRIARYLNNIVFEPRDLRFALVEASEGSIGSPVDSFLLFMCYQYDPDADSFTPSAWKIMRAGGALTAILLVGGMSVMWLREFRRRHGSEGAHMSGSGATHAG